MEALGPFSAPTSSLISCAGGSIWRPAGSHLGKASPAPVLQLHPAGGGGHALVWPFCCRRETGEKRKKQRDPGGIMGRERDQERKAGGRGRCPSEVNDLFTNLTLNLPTLLEAEYGRLTEKSRSERPPSCMTNLSALPLTSWVTLDQLLILLKPVSSSTKRDRCSLWPCSSKGGPWMSSTDITWELLRNSEAQPAQTYRIRTCGLSGSLGVSHEL